VVFSVQRNNALLRKFCALGSSLTGPPKDMARAIEKRREVIAPAAMLKVRRAATGCDLRALASSPLTKKNL